MKAVTLAGGPGTRVSEETPHALERMIEIGGKPLLRLAVTPVDSRFGIPITVCAAVGAEHGRRDLLRNGASR
jgi:dTDP-glucose pyrophosphorylase